MNFFFIFLIVFAFNSNAYADKLLKDGFLNNKMDYSKNQNIDDSKNKIILIYNHGQEDHDDPSNNCAWKNGIRNFSSLVGEKINGKEWKEPVKKYHDMDMVDCFQYYNPTILKFIESRI
jgi:hypothetical protein